MDDERGPFLSNPFVARASRWGLLAWSLIGLLILAWGLYRFVLYPIRIALPPLAVALIILYLLNPAVDLLGRRRVNRVLGTALAYVVILGAFALWLATIVPVISHQVSQFVGGVPALLSRAQRTIDGLGRRLGLTVNGKDLMAAFQPSSGEVFKFLGRITSFTSGFLQAVFTLVLGPLIGFYFLVDLPKIRRGAAALVPVRRREEWLGLAGRVGETLGGFFRGQLVVAFIVGHAAALGFWVIGMPDFAVFGALAGMLALVPLIGTAVAAVPTLIVAAAAGGRTGGLLHARGGWPLVLLAAAVLILVQQLDTRLLTPRLHAPSVRLHPITVLLSLLIGGTLLGLWGMILAVPAVAAGKLIVLHVWDTRAQWPPRSVTPTPLERGRSGRSAAGGSG